MKKYLPPSIVMLEHFQNHETNRKGYLTGLAYDLYTNPNNDRNAHYFARELFYNFKFKSSIEAFKAHIEMNGWAAERARSMVFIGEALMAEGKTQEAFSWFLRAFDTEPNSREPFMEIAEYYYKIKNPHKLIPYVAAALQIKGADFYANYQPYYEHYPHEMMYWALWNIGELSAASEHFKVCLAYRPFEPKYLHDMRWFIDLPKMTFIIPTLGRPEGLRRCLDSIKNLNYPQEKIKIVIVSDGEPMDWRGDTQETIIMNAERIGVPKSLKKAVEFTKGEENDYIVYASNDVEFTPDSLIIAVKTAMDNNKRFMAFNTGEVYPNKGNICEHFMIHRSMLDKIDGEIFDTSFRHLGVDNLLYEKLNRLNQFMRCERAIVNHYHFSKTGEPMDEVYKLAWNDEDAKHDRDLLEKKLDELKNKPIQL